MVIDLHIKTTNKLLIMDLLGKLEDDAKTVKIIKESIKMAQNSISEAIDKLDKTEDDDEIRKINHYIDESEKRLRQLKKEYDLALKNVPSVEIKLGSLTD